MPHLASVIVQDAERLCRERGARLTDQRRRVLELIAASDKPVGAYELLDQLRTEMPRVAPPTVYRALEFLLDQGFIHRLSTLSAFITCEHPDHPHTGEFLICRQCGEVTELEDEAVAASLGQAAAASGFQPEQRVVEVSGTCARCGKATK